MKRRVWIEIRYGNPAEHNLLICRSEDTQLMNAVKRKLLDESLAMANLWQGIDEPKALQLKGNYRKLKSILELLIPEKSNDS